MDEHLSIFRRDVIPGRKPHWVNIGFVERSKVEEIMKDYLAEDDMRPLLFITASPINPTDDYLEALYARTMQPVAETYHWSNN